jgi:hypothetical protein
MSSGNGPKTISTSVKKGKREQKKLEMEASSMIQSFSAAASSASETEIQWIEKKLKGNANLMHTISGVLKNPALVGLLDGTLAEEDMEEKSPSPKKKGTSTILRASIRKMKHLVQTPSLPLALLEHLEPAIFTSEAAWLNEDQVGILCRALGCNRNCDLPSKHYEGIDSVPSLKKAMEIQYAKHGKIYAGLQPELVKKGLFEVDGNEILCNSSGMEGKSVDLGEDAEDVTLLDSFDPMTTVRVTVDGMDLIVDDLLSSFVEQGLLLRDPLATWELSPTFVPKKAKVQLKRKASFYSTLESQPGSSSGGSTKASSSSGAVQSTSSTCPLSSVLQRRINEKRK